MIISKLSIWTIPNKLRQYYKKLFHINKYILIIIKLNIYLFNGEGSKR